jgi:signal transduction histidine kinase
MSLPARPLIQYLMTACGQALHFLRARPTTAASRANDTQGLVHNVEPETAALKGLAVFLAERREAILTAWRSAVDSDPELTTASTITRAQFIDHIPAVLDAFERRLSAERATERVQAREDQKESAAEHGLHRWQQGYNQPETMCEWGHLHLCLLQELETYHSLNPGIEPSAMQTARRELVRLCSDGVNASASRYAHLQRREADSRVRELESALAQLQELERARAEAWREAAHDLRGRAHAIASASAVLTRDDVPEQHRTRFSEVLKLGVQSLNRLLGDLMDQARLEAGHERRQISHFDVASLMKEYCDTTRALAAEKGLFLVARGNTPLMIDGDAGKIQRILQNLVLNAIKVTERGGVKVTWEASDDERRPQWSLCVQDTGPGFTSGSATPLERVLKRATDEAHEVEQRNRSTAQFDPQSDSAPTLPSQSPPAPTQMPAGEGIGLSIVKRLCEMLDASLELESSAGEGTTFRILFPRRYPESST